MCGVLGLVSERFRPDLGRIAAELLKTLEYRGYDSTGAAIQGDGFDVDLRKDVGAPSKLVETLGITRLGGRLFCGQVRWATFGAITAANAQPHVVGCKEPIYGAHNGNVTNCDPLKQWLEAEGHHVRSDNDGEMVVHTIEHELSRQLAALDPGARGDASARRAAMRRAISAGAARLKGSYAAVIVDPQTRCAWAIKQGSSLYFGVGRDEAGGRFGLASSDLSSVLRLTRVLVPLREGELVEFDGVGHQVHAVASGAPIERPPVRSALRARDTALAPGFETFMEQEIAAQPETVRHVLDLLAGGSARTRALAPALGALAPEAAERLRHEVAALRERSTDEQLVAAFRALAGDPALGPALDAAPRALGDAAPALGSSEAGVLEDLVAAARGPRDRLALQALDALIEQAEARDFAAAVDRFAELCLDAVAAGGRVLAVSCGSSYNAARTAALFWNELCNIELVPLLPGEFRERVARTLRAGDLLVSISQSGETKDLVDVLNDVAATGLPVKRVGLVNNLNSTLAQEKSDHLIPLRCGPEIAVPATKSFMNQLAVLYCLAVRLGERRGLPVDAARLRLERLPALLERTARDTAPAIEEAARLLYLAPSVHLLATRLSGLAREGALKIRETVLDHAEGFEGSEFKHGPNTLLGWNTVLGPGQVGALLRALGARGVDPRAAADALAAGAPGPLDGAALKDALYADYPLVFLTGPDERDVHLTISQINTHKIRGASTIVIAEEHPALRQAAEKAPSDNPGYRSIYIPLPESGDPLHHAFSATVVLQRLALRMSALKARYLDGLGVPDHGVHPDVPKNVSKSITVD